MTFRFSILSDRKLSTQSSSLAKDWSKRDPVLHAKLSSLFSVHVGKHKIWCSSVCTCMCVYTLSLRKVETSHKEAVYYVNVFTRILVRPPGAIVRERSLSSLGMFVPIRPSSFNCSRNRHM